MIRSSNPYATISHSLPMLRGLAIIWITAYHLLGNTQGYLSGTEAIAAFSQGGLQTLVDTGLKLLIGSGNVGVNVFLVISGFGLTSSWWKKYGSRGMGAIPLAEFWQKRVFRIFPLFWASVVLSGLIYGINPDWAPFGQQVWEQGNLAIWGAWLSTVTTLRNFIPDYYYFLNGAWWYVGLSLQLYLAFPFLIKVGQSWGWSRLLTSALFFSLAYRAVIAFAPVEGLWSTISLSCLPARLFEFVFGMYLAVMFIEPRSDAPQSRCRAYDGLQSLLEKPLFLPLNLGLLLTGLAFRWSPFPILHIFDNSFIAVGLFCGLVCLFHQLKRMGLPTAVASLFKLTGQYSYGIYLTHMNIYLVLWPMASQLVPSYWPRFVLVTALSCLLGTGFEAGYGWIQSNLRRRKIAA